jgi:hypothetical protein
MSARPELTKVNHQGNQRNRSKYRQPLRAVQSPDLNTLNIFLCVVFDGGLVFWP